MASHLNAYRGSSTTTLELPQKSRTPSSISKLELPPSSLVRPREAFASRNDTENGLELSTLRSSSLPVVKSENQPKGPVHTPADDAKHVKRERLYIAACCWCLFLAGWNDGSTGPLLPAIQKHYQVLIIL